MNFKRNLWAPAIVLGAFAVAAPAFATPAVYTDRAAFDLATTGQTTYGWPEFAGGGSVNLVGDSISKDGVTFQSGNGDLWRDDDAYGVPYLAVDVSLDSGKPPLTITVTGTALGLYLGDYYGAQTVTYTYGGLTGSLTIPKRDDTVFFGITGDAGPLTLSFSNNDEIDVTSFITATSTTATTSPAPEPMTLAIFGAGLLGAAAARRRKTA